jgi:hypothetical protein
MASSRSHASKPLWHRGFQAACCKEGLGWAKMGPAGLGRQLIAHSRIFLGTSISPGDVFVGAGYGFTIGLDLLA